MKIRFIHIFFILLFIFIFYVFFLGLQKSNIYTPKFLTEKKVPKFQSKILGSGKKISSEEIFKRKDYYLLNIWASWCVPCRIEHPLLLNLSREKNIEIIGLNYKDDKKNAMIYLNNFGNPYKTVIIDYDGTISIEWGAFGVPETFLIYDNKIIKKMIGPINQEFLSEIDSLIR
tara:strand:- start:590 stop:1108 length:519 start_codon:yes stop_codon:yes gene_type:complete